MTNKNENQETYYFYDKNFVEALSIFGNIREENNKEIQLEFEKIKDGDGNQRWKLISDESVVKKVNNLNLSKREIKNIEGIGNFSNLEYLNLSNNQISELPEEIGKLKKLKYLLLNDNKIEKIFSEIGNLSNLENLWLGGNQIKNIPSEIGNLEKLESLDLNSNQIKEIPSEIGNLTNLKKLYLDSNQIKELPSEIGNLKNLNVLYFKKNKSLGKLAKNYSLYQNNVYKNEIREDKGFKIEVNTNEKKIRISKIHK